MNSETIIQLAVLYGEAKQLKQSTVSTYLAGSGDFLDRLHNGCDVTTRRATRVTQYFSDHWPLDLMWPLDIPRPDPVADSPAVQAMIARQNLNKTENESDNPLITLNAKGHIADPEAFCEAISFGCAVQRTSFDQVVHQYADGRPRYAREPRKGSISADILRHLVAAGDVRFADRIKREAEGRELAKKLGLVA